MELRLIDATFAVAPQMRPEELPALAAKGYGAVICNRPDGEEAGQPPLDELRAAANAAGLAFHHIPVAGGAFPEGAVAAFAAVRRGTEGPLLAYCRTGTRSITLETLANPMGLSADERLERAKAAGYDLGALAPRLGG
ncbi:MAG: TIGR01244 family sulfur transferase [Erythrobacter sp.]